MIEAEAPLSPDDLERLLEADTPAGLVSSGLVEIVEEGPEEILSADATVRTVLPVSRDRNPRLATRTIDYRALDGPSN